MTRRRPFISRLVLAILVAVAVMLQGVPLIQAHVPGAEAVVASAHAAASDVPCHSDRDTEHPVPGAPKPASVACCSTFACGMLSQALPPDTDFTATRFVTRFLRPAVSRSIALAEPDPAWRPPARFI